MNENDNVEKRKSYPIWYDSLLWFDDDGEMLGYRTEYWWSYTSALATSVIILNSLKLHCFMAECRNFKLAQVIFRNWEGEWKMQRVAGWCTGNSVPMSKICRQQNYCYLEEIDFRSLSYKCNSIFYNGRQEAFKFIPSNFEQRGEHLPSYLLYVKRRMQFLCAAFLNVKHTNLFFSTFYNLVIYFIKLINWLIKSN